jgi:CheY-like chemotaxis protein
MQQVVYSAMPRGKRMQAKKLLLIEDEPAVASLLYEILIDEGYDVTLAESGEEGLVLLTESPPDLVLSDVMMPGINGHELCQKITADPDFNNLPVVLMSAAHDKAVCEGCRSAGFIPKPFALDHVLQTIAAAIEQHKAQ